MTTLEKLQISGIRSYDPYNPSVIKFYKPLTLIIGKNGSGKTTIIEALKFVCTGQNPPDSSKGKSFVHDPLLSNECIVKAQIKLSLKTFENKPVTIIRSFQLTQNVKSRRYQQIDATIKSVNENGQKITATHRCAEIDSIATHLINVSKAIISNVIFCHQEDSLWPLSDSKTLKIKFDDIFSSTRYSKSLDRIKVIRKNLRTKISFLEKDLILRQSNLKSFRKYNSDLKNLKAQIKLLNSTINNINKDIKNNQNILKKYDEKYQKLNGLKSDLQNNNFKFETLNNEKKKVKETIKVHYNKSKEDLNKMIVEINNKICEIDEKINNSEKKLIDIKKSLIEMKNDNKNNSENIGKLKAEEERNEKALNKLVHLSNKFTEKYNLKKQKGDCIMKAQLIIENLFMKVNEKRKELKCISDRYFNKENKERLEIQKIRTVIDTNKQILKQSEKEFNLITKSIEEDTNKINIINNEINSMDKIKSLISSTNNELIEINKNKIKTSFNSQIRSNQNELKILKNNLKIKNEKIDKFKHYKQKKEILEIKQRDYEIKEKKYKLQFEKIKKLYKTVYNKDLPENFSDNFKLIISKLVTNTKNERSKLTQTIRKEKENSGSCLGKLSVFNGEIKKLSELINRKKSEIPESIDFDKLDKNIKENKEKLKKIQTNILFEKGALFIYKKIINKIEEYNKCPICEKKLIKSESINAINTLSNKIKKFQNNQINKKYEIKEKSTKNKINDLSSMIPRKENVIKLKKNLEIKEFELKKYKNEYKNCEKRLKSYETEETKLISIGNKLSVLSTNATQFDKLQKDFESSKIVFLEEKKNFHFDLIDEKAIVDDMDDKEVLMKRIKEKEINLSKSIDEKENLLNSKHQIMLKLSNLRKEENKINSFFNRKKELQETIEKNKKILLCLRDNVKITENKIQITEKEINNKIEINKEKSIEYKIESNSKEEIIKNMEKEIEIFEELFNSIKKFKKLENERKEIFKIFNKNNENMIRFEKLKESEEKKIKFLENIMKHNNFKLNDLKNNLVATERSKTCNDIKSKIKEIKLKIDLLENKEKTNEKLKNHKIKDDEFKKLLFEAEGRRSAFKDQCIEIEKNIKINKSFENIEEKFKENFVELETNLIANKDLEIYYKAVDKALIEFHSNKMKEINKILKRYWKLIYKGNDIDYIEIVSSTSDIRNPISSSFRNYNYFVVMAIGQLKLEMRGRCSAGQKVLASLLIRLSLAEAFCNNCNILALDEPTNNLDEENAKSFGESLNELISNKKNSSDFQLILITHNESFAELVGKKQFVEKYYSISKNENNHSKIKLIEKN